MRGAQFYPSLMPSALLQHAMSSMCRTQPHSASRQLCIGAIRNNGGPFQGNQHAATCGWLPFSSTPYFRRTVQHSPQRPRLPHQHRHMQKGASASSIMLEQEERFKVDQERELNSVNIALAANSLIFVAKSAAWFVSGGSSLLAEAIHSLADIGNQAMLRVGITYAAQAPTAQYPFGHMRDKFIFSLISAVGIFCLGAGVSIVHGIHAIASPAAHGDNMWGIVALIFSTIVEGATLVVAIRAVAAGARSSGIGFLEYIKSGRDPVSVAIMAEDGAAVAGVLVAAACTMLVDYTGVMAWDGIGSVLVGLILGGVAIFLIQRNRSFLIGRSMKPADFKKIVRHLKQDPVVKNIYEAKSEEIGEGIYRVSAEVDFHGPNLLERYMSTKDVKHMRHQFSNAVAAPNTQEFENMMKAYGTEVVGLVGAQVDRIEAEVMQLVPGVRYVDLETDRGRFSTYNKATQSFDEVEDIRAETFRQQPDECATQDSSGGATSAQVHMMNVVLGEEGSVRDGNGAAVGQESLNGSGQGSDSGSSGHHSQAESDSTISKGGKESSSESEAGHKPGKGIGTGGGSGSK